MGQQRFYASMSIVFIVVCVLTTRTISTNSSSTDPPLKQKGLILNLIHRDLIHPPTYPPVGSAIANRTSYPKQIGFVKTREASFYVAFFIGSERVRQYAALDTGSDILWVQCAGYKKGHKTASRVYDPSKSSSFKNSTCLRSGDRYCKIAPGGGCDDKKRCKYSIKYEDKTHSKGFIGFETLTFNFVRTPMPIYDVLFGCGIDNYNFNKHEDGIFGIGGIMELSILEKTGKKFSFCFGDINNHTYNYNHLALGDDAKLRGVPVPFTLDEHEYHVDVQTITIGTRKLVLKKPVSVMIDSGSTLSYLRKDIHKQISSIVEKEMGKRMVKKKISELPKGLCYKGPTLVKPFPSMNIVLGPRTTIRLDIDTLFWKTPLKDDVFCLAFLPSSSDDSVIGATALQYYNVGFDLINKQAYLDKILDCESLLQN